eukprot:scaffold7958_cov430-Prasinococcus_capsulatus_cf.AAC.2
MPTGHADRLSHIVVYLAWAGVVGSHRGVVDMAQAGPCQADSRQMQAGPRTDPEGPREDPSDAQASSCRAWLEDHPGGLHGPVRRVLGHPIVRVAAVAEGLHPGCAEVVTLAMGAVERGPQAEEVGSQPSAQHRQSPSPPGPCSG